MHLFHTLTNARAQDFEGELHTQANTSRVGPIQLIFEPIKVALLEQCKSWKWAFGRALNERAAAAMSEILGFFEGLQTRLSRPIKDLDDIRGAMAALAELRDNEIRIDSGIPPIEETYAMLNRFELVFSDGNAEKVDSLAYGWKKLRALAHQVEDELLTIQPKFKGDLVDGIVQFKEDLAVFLDDYAAKGPNVAGIDPREASERLAIYQTRFDELWRKYTTYSGGEELFGLPITDYPDLQVRSIAYSSLVENLVWA